MNESSRYSRFSTCKPFVFDSRKTLTLDVMLHFQGSKVHRVPGLRRRDGTLTDGVRTNCMRYKTALFAALFVLTFGLERLLPVPTESFLISWHAEGSLSPQS
jgi:hypothetical protein